MEYLDCGQQLSMRLERLTTASINVMGLAHAEAERTGFTYVGVEHILLGLLAEPHGIAYEALKKNGLQLRDARTQMAKQTKEEKLSARKNFALSDGAKKVLTTAEAIADQHSIRLVGTEHLLLAVLHVKNWRTRDLLDSFGVDIERLRADVESGKCRQPGVPVQASQEAHSSPDFSAPAFHDFTDHAIRVITVAQEESKRLGHNFVGSEQLLLGLLSDGGIAGNQFRKMSITLNQARREVEKIIGRGSGFMGFEIPFTSRAKSILLDAKEQANDLGNKMVGAEHLMLALLAQEDCVAACVLQNLKVDLQQLRGNVVNASLRH